MLEGQALMQLWTRSAARTRLRQWLRHSAGIVSRPFFCRFSDAHRCLDGTARHKILARLKRNATGASEMKRSPLPGLLRAKIKRLSSMQRNAKQQAQLLSSITLLAQTSRLLLGRPKTAGGQHGPAV